MSNSEVKIVLLEMAKKLAEDRKFRDEVEKDRAVLKEFINRFPFKDNPFLIEQLSPELVYLKGSRESLLYFLEFRLKRVGTIFVHSARPMIEARNNLELFKQLLKLIVDDSKQIHEKIDDPRWSQLKGWGGDKHIVKKLLFVYYPDRLLPTFKTEMLEFHIERLGLNRDVQDAAKKKYNESMSNLSVGKKFELYNEVLLKEFSILPKVDGFEWDSCAIARLLDRYNPLPQPIVSKGAGGPLAGIPILYEPVNELGVVLLFGMYHRQLGFPYIIKVQQTFPDMSALDEEGNLCRIEFEYNASAFRQHGHDPNGCDYIICWIDDLDEKDPLKDKTISLKEEIFKNEETGEE